MTSNNESDDYFSSYYDEDFEDYSDGSSEDDLTFSITANEKGLNTNFKKVVEEL